MSYRETREMHKAVCVGCGKECKVPFKPEHSRPVTGEIVGQKDARAISTSVASTLLLCVDFVEHYIRFRENIQDVMGCYGKLNILRSCGC